MHNGGMPLQMKASSIRLRPLAPILAAIACLFFAAPLRAADSVDGSINVNGVTRSYRLFVPGAVKGKRPPAFVMLHGATGTSAQQERYSNFDELAAREGLAVVYPQGIGRRWNDGRKLDSASTADDVAFLRTLIGKLVAQGDADPKRVYVVGISNGGMMSLHMACVASDLIAGIGVVAAEMPAAVDCPSPRPMPVIIFHGTGDRIVPFDGGPIHAGLRNRGSVHSNAETVAFWQRENGCGAPTRHEIAGTNSSSGMRVVVEDFPCPPGRGLKDVIVEGGGHTWPGAHQGLIITMLLGRVTDDINADDMMWQFFQSQSLSDHP
jgi:polyhydroxybutyrate depolymerase